MKHQNIRRPVNTPSHVVDTRDSRVYTIKEMEFKSKRNAPEDFVAYTPNSLQEQMNTIDDLNEELSDYLNFMKQYLPLEYAIYEIITKPLPEELREKDFKKYIETTLKITRSTREKSEARSKHIFELYCNPYILTEAEVFKILKKINARAAGIKRLIDSGVSIEKAAMEKRISVDMAKDAFEFAVAFLHLAEKRKYRPAL
ncbi:MAG: hypothetical protein AB1746_12900 [Candidatus Zixiibacteriota bacterium]